MSSTSPLSPRVPPSSRSPSSPRGGARRPTRRDLPSTAVALSLAAQGDLPGLRTALARAPELARAADPAGRTALHVAAASGRPAVVRELLLRGADSAATDISGRTPAADAAAAGAIDALRALASADAPLPGRLRPAHLQPGISLARDLAAAAATGDVRAARVLVAAFGANVNYANTDHRTPLHLAVAEGHVEVAHYLLTAGADPDRPDRRGVTAKQAALSSPDPRLNELFAPPSAPDTPRGGPGEERDLRPRGQSLPRITRVKRAPVPVPPPVVPVSVPEVQVVKQKKHQSAPHIVRVESPRHAPQVPPLGADMEYPSVPYPPPPPQQSLMKLGELDMRQELEKRQLKERQEMLRMQEEERRLMDQEQARQLAAQKRRAEQEAQLQAEQQALRQAQQQQQQRRTIPPTLQLVQNLNTIEVRPHTPQGHFAPRQQVVQQLPDQHERAPQHVTEQYLQQHRVQQQQVPPQHLPQQQRHVPQQQVPQQQMHQQQIHQQQIHQEQVHLSANEVHLHQQDHRMHEQHRVQEHYGQQRQVHQQHVHQQHVQTLPQEQANPPQAQYVPSDSRNVQNAQQQRRNEELEQQQAKQREYLQHRLQLRQHLQQQQQHLQLRQQSDLQVQHQQEQTAGQAQPLMQRSHVEIVQEQATPQPVAHVANPVARTLSAGPTLSVPGPQ